jgi:hypothetical protein
MSNKTTIITLVALGGITYYLYLRGGQSQNTVDNPGSPGAIINCQEVRHWTDQEKYDCWVKNNML